jgi:hypothetical protein
MDEAPANMLNGCICLLLLEQNHYNLEKFVPLDGAETAPRCTFLQIVTTKANPADGAWMCL